MGAKRSKARQTQSRGMVLLDVVDGAEERFDVSFLERADHTVTVCHGPAAGTVCPLLAEDLCDKYALAHGIVFELDLDNGQHRAILATYRNKNPDIPIRVVVTDQQARRYGQLLTGVETWSQLPTVAELDGFAAEVEAADRDIG